MIPRPSSYQMRLLQQAHRRRFYRHTLPMQAVLVDHTHHTSSGTPWIAPIGHTTLWECKCSVCYVQMRAHSGLPVQPAGGSNHLPVLQQHSSAPSRLNRAELAHLLHQHNSKQQPAGGEEHLNSASMDYSLHQQAHQACGAGASIQIGIWHGTGGLFSRTPHGTVWNLPPSGPILWLHPSSHRCIAVTEIITPSPQHSGWQGFKN